VAAHVAAAADALRQSAFPAAGRWAPPAAASGVLVGAVYAPLLAAASVLAWPGLRGGPGTGRAHEGYLVDRRAYHLAGPSPGDRVWYRPDPRGEPDVGRVVAARGQGVEWRDDRLRVDGRTVDAPDSLRRAAPLLAFAYEVPDGHVLVEPGDPVGGGRPAPCLVLVADDQIIGRAWARLYPLWDRRLLP